MKTYLDSKSGKLMDGLVQEVVEEDLSLRPHLNSVLRAEIIFFTAQVSVLSRTPLCWVMLYGNLMGCWSGRGFELLQLTRRSPSSRESRWYLWRQA